MTMYKLKLIATKYTRVGEGYEYVDVELVFIYHNFDDVMSMIGQLIAGNESGSVKFSVETLREEDDK